MVDGEEGLWNVWGSGVRGLSVFKERTEAGDDVVGEQELS